jgi:hypothetical protein
LSIAGIVEQFRKFETVHGLATLISYIFFNLFVVAYFMPEVASMMGVLIVPMLIYVALYDWWLSDLDLQPKSPNFLKPLPEVKSKMSDMTAMLILLPGYIAGIAVAYRAFMNV